MLYYNNIKINNVRVLDLIWFIDCILLRKSLDVILGKLVLLLYFYFVNNILICMI